MAKSKANLDQYKMEVASELGVQFGSHYENRDKPCGYFGQVGGEMVRRALADQFGLNSGAITVNPTAYYNNSQRTQ